MNRDHRILKSASVGGNVLEESLPGVSIIEICENKRVLIENHQGIIRYDFDEIIVKTRRGCICICGNNLKLNRMSKVKLVVTGQICSVNMQGRG